MVKIAKVNSFREARLTSLKRFPIVNFSREVRVDFLGEVFEG